MARLRKRWFIANGASFRIMLERTPPDMKPYRVQDVKSSFRRELKSGCGEMEVVQRLNKPIDSGEVRFGNQMVEIVVEPDEHFASCGNVCWRPAVVHHRVSDRKLQPFRIHIFVPVGEEIPEIDRPPVGLSLIIVKNGSPLPRARPAAE